MNKKMLFGILAIALVGAAAAASVASDTWLDRFLTITMKTGSLQSMEIFDDCAATTVVTGHDFGMVTQGNSYEWTVYVLNCGSEQMYITYDKTWYEQDAGQSKFYVNVTVIEYGVPCQMSGSIPSPVKLPVYLQEKNTANATQGFCLPPTKMIKLDITIRADRVVVGKSYSFQFEIAGVSVN